MSEQKQFIGNTYDLNNTQILNKSAFLNVWGTSPQKHFRLFVLYFEKILTKCKALLLDMLYILGIQLGLVYFFLPG